MMLKKRLKRLIWCSKDYIQELSKRQFQPLWLSLKSPSIRLGTKPELTNIQTAPTTNPKEMLWNRKTNKKSRLRNHLVQVLRMPTILMEQWLWWDKWEEWEGWVEWGWWVRCRWVLLSSVRWAAWCLSRSWEDRDKCQVVSHFKLANNKSMNEII